VKVHPVPDRQWVLLHVRVWV